VNYCLRNADKLIVGRALGATDLGYYSFAQRMADYPAKLVSDALSPVMLPALSRIQDDDVAMQRSVLRAAGATALLTFPLVCGSLVVAGPTADFLFGAKWAPAVPLFMVMVVAAAATSLSYALSVVYRAKGRTDWLFRWGLIRGLAALSGSVLGVSWGVTGVAVAGTVVTGLCTYPSFALPLHLVGLKVAVLLQRVRPAGVASAIMLGGVLALRALLAWMAWPSLPIAILCTLLGVVLYAAAIRWIRPPEVADLVRLVGRT
jgi:PST family polysaccharide transporter